MSSAAGPKEHGGTDGRCQLCDAESRKTHLTLTCDHVLCEACFEFTRSKCKICCPACNRHTILSSPDACDWPSEEGDLPPNKRPRLAPSSQASSQGGTASEVGLSMYRDENDACQRCRKDEIGFWCDQCRCWLCVPCTADVHLSLERATTSHSQHDVTSLSARKLELYKDLKLINKYLDRHSKMLKQKENRDKAEAIVIEDISRFKRYFSDLNNVETFVLRRRSIHDCFPWVIEIMRDMMKSEAEAPVSPDDFRLNSASDAEPNAEDTKSPNIAHAEEGRGHELSGSPSPTFQRLSDAPEVWGNETSAEKLIAKRLQKNKDSSRIHQSFRELKTLKDVHPEQMRGLFGNLWVSNGIFHEKTDYFVQTLDEQLEKVDELCGNFAKCSDMIQLNDTLAILAMCKPKGHTGAEPEVGLYQLKVTPGCKTLSHIPVGEGQYSALSSFGDELFAVPSFGRRTIECFRLERCNGEEEEGDTWSKSATLEIHESKGQPVLEPISCLHVTKNHMFVVMREKLIMTSRTGKIVRLLAPTSPMKAWACQTLCKSDDMTSDTVFVVFRNNNSEMHVMYAYDSHADMWTHLDLVLPESKQAHVYSACCVNNQVYVHCQYQIIAYSPE